MRSVGRDLERVLPDHGVVGSELSLVSPSTAYEPTRVGLLRDFLTERLRPMIQACTLALEAEKVARHEAEARASKEASRRANRRGERKASRAAGGPRSRATQNDQALATT